MGEFFCEDCGKQVQPTPNYKSKDGVIEASVTSCPYCGSKKKLSFKKVFPSTVTLMYSTV